MSLSFYGVTPRSSFLASRSCYNNSLIDIAIGTRVPVSLWFVETMEASSELVLRYSRSYTGLSKSIRAARKSIELQTAKV